MSLTPSWDDHYGETDSPAMRYQRGIDWRTREDMMLGIDTPDGYRQPPLEMCRQHNYGVVDGLCGVCLEILKADRRAA